MASGKQAPAAAEEPARDDEFDPVYEWLDDGDSYLLRLNLAPFKKEDFRVHVDAAGRLTVISQQGRTPRLHKAFQLPNTANLDGITGRFDGGVLTLTVPKLLQPDAVAPMTETKKEQAAAGEPKDQQEDKAAAAPKVGRAKVEDKAEKAPPVPDEKAKGARRDQEDKASADHRAHVAREAERRIEAARAKVAEEAKRRTQADEKASAAARAKDEEEKGKRKAEAAAAAPVPGDKEVDKARRDHYHEEEKASADHRAYVEREAARRIEAARAKMAEAKAVAERTGGNWKERAAAEGFKWAETMGRKKEVIATAVAAFTLGVVVSQAFGRR